MQQAPQEKANIEYRTPNIEVDTKEEQRRSPNI